MALPIKKYAFINAKLRARISKLIPEETFGRMESARSLEEAIGLLQGTAYGDLAETYKNTGDLKFGEFELYKNEVRMYGEVEKYLFGAELEMVRALSLNYEIENLKNALRLYFDRKILHTTIEDRVYYIYRDKIHHEVNVEKIINAENKEEVSAALNGTPYAGIFNDNQDVFNPGGTLFPLEIALDQFFYSNLTSHAESLQGRDRDDTLRLVGVEIDLQNINWMLRFKFFYELPLEKVLALIIPQGFGINEKSIKEAYNSQDVSRILQDALKARYPGITTMISSGPSDLYSRLQLIEEVLEKIMLREVRRILAGYPFTIGIILSYFLLKKIEIKKVRTILNAKQYSLPGGAASQ
jgi:V/A-type H+-transporting ATPase subunit C